MYKSHSWHQIHFSNISLCHKNHGTRIVEITLSKYSDSWGHSRADTVFSRHNEGRKVRTSVPSPKCGGPIDAEIDEEHFPGLHLNPVLTSEEWWCPRQWRSQFLSFLLCASLSFMTMVLPMHVNVFCRLFFPLPIRNLSSVTLISPAVSVVVLILLIMEEETGVWGFSGKARIRIADTSILGITQRGQNFPDFYSNKFQSNP